MWVLLWVLKNWIALLLSCSCLVKFIISHLVLDVETQSCVSGPRMLVLLCHHCVSYPLAGIVMSSFCVCQVHWPVLLCHHCVCQVHWPVLLCHHCVCQVHWLVVLYHCMCVRSIGQCCYVIVCVSDPLVRVVMSSLCVSGPLASVVMSSLYVCQVHWPVLLCHHCMCVRSIGQCCYVIIVCVCVCVRSIGWCCYVIIACVSGPLAGVLTSSLCVSGPLAGVVDVKLKLPPGLTCSQCVLQWKWHAGEHPPSFWLCSLSQGHRGFRNIKRTLMGFFHKFDFNQIWTVYNYKTCEQDHR